MLVARLGYWENSFWNLGQLCGVLVHGFCVGVFGNIRGLELRIFVRIGSEFCVGGLGARRGEFFRLRVLIRASGAAQSRSAGIVAGCRRGQACFVSLRLSAESRTTPA